MLKSDGVYWLFDWCVMNIAVFVHERRKSKVYIGFWLKKVGTMVNVEI